jgi:hypothetical protein
MVAAAEQHGDLVGIKAVVLALAAVDGLHVQGVAEHEGNLLGGAQVRQPIPGEHALAADHQTVAKGRDGPEKGPRLGPKIDVQQHRARLVEDADVQGSRVQIDTAVESMLLLVKAHHGLLGGGLEC